MRGEILMGGELLKSLAGAEVIILLKRHFLLSGHSNCTGCRVTEHAAADYERIKQCILTKPVGRHLKKKYHMSGVVCVCSVSEFECVMAMTVFICLCAFLCLVSAVMARGFISVVLLKMR
jgi:hypothetical protein